MLKDFDTWNELKKIVDERAQLPYFREREVWWCSLGLNVGHEEDGKHNQYERPVLVLKKFNRELFWALPLSTPIGSSRYHFALYRNRDEISYLLLSQLRLISSRRLTRRMYSLDLQQFHSVIYAVKRLLDERWN
jgi:mRNA interferase MazF